MPSPLPGVSEDGRITDPLAYWREELPGMEESYLEQLRRDYIETGEFDVVEMIDAEIARR